MHSRQATHLIFVFLGSCERNRLVKQYHHRRLALGGTCPPPGGLEAFALGDSCGAPSNFLMKQTLCFASVGCAWSTRLWAISQGSNAGVFLELWLRIEAYLRVFGDDCVRGTREQMMLQVVLVERKAGALQDRLAGDTCRQAPNAYDDIVPTSIAWWDNSYRPVSYPHLDVYKRQGLWDVTLDAAQPQDVASQPSMQSFVQVTRAPKHSTQPSQQATQRSRGRAIMRLKLNVRRGRI
ncbi:hypothetical protein DEO72_LG2g3135 [Vigna unguiculata]|uniref:Uncharacterized protein n=1 Tax=Vigna unguiculata TaxID=3917 RepID=A0A4D6L2W7_VIGUN|nr:hypothetical protein DEO72_LG2g3135 [Vigna unguiculata]